MKPKSRDISTIYANELDQGAYISDTLTIDTTDSSGCSGRDIPNDASGEPPTKEAAENLFNNLFFSEDRYELSAVGRMKFNRRLGRDVVQGPSTLDDKDIIETLQCLIDIRNGKGMVDDIDHLEIGA